MKYLILLFSTIVSFSAHASSHFKSGSAVPTRELVAELQKVFDEKIKDKQIDTVIIEGHTDSVGSAASNQKLSEARARAAANKLIEMGVDQNKIKAVGKGESELLIKEISESDRTKNRRIVVIVGEEKTVISEGKSCAPTVVERRVVQHGPKNVIMLGARYDYTDLSSEVGGNTAKVYSHKGLVPEVSYLRRRVFDSNFGAGVGIDVKGSPRGFLGYEF